MFSRRAFIGSSLATTLLAPRLAFARAATNKRFVFIIQRGAADGLATLMPLGDPAYAGLRGGQAVAGGVKLDATFTLHPSLAETAKLYAAKEALFGHALGLTFKDRSHFDAQNVLETGGMTAYAEKTGWMNRLLGLLPETSALAVAQAIPVAMRGEHAVATYAPSKLPAASDDLLARVAQLYAADAQLAPLWATAMETRALAGDIAGGRNGAATGELAARLMAPADGARIVMIETGGWDTHSGQRARLANQLKGLDAMIAALKTGLGPAWADTVVLVATEFGRTAALNGTGGTDHGTASAAMLLGGAVQGGRIVTDWPGLSPSALYEGRDLKPTMQLEAFIAGALASHFALDPARVARTVYPAIAGLKPPDGYARA